MEKSLFHINNEYLQLAAQLEESGGEITEEMEQALIINQNELAQKSENYLYVIARLKAECEMAKQHEDQAKLYRKRKEVVIDRLQNALLDAVKIKGEKYEAGISTIGTRKSTSVKVNDVSLLPDEYLTRKVVETPNKTKIGAALKSGEKVPGCELEESLNLKIN